MKYKITFWFDQASRKTAEAEVRKILDRATSFKRCGSCEIRAVSERSTVSVNIDIPELRQPCPPECVSQVFIEEHIHRHFGNKAERLKFACLVIEPLSDLETLADCARPDNRKGL